MCPDLDELATDAIPTIGNQEITESQSPSSVLFSEIGGRKPSRKRLVDLLDGTGNSTRPKLANSGSISVESRCLSGSDHAPKASFPRLKPTQTPLELKPFHTDNTRKSDTPNLSGLRGSRVTYARQRSFLGDSMRMTAIDDGDVLAPSLGSGETSHSYISHQHEQQRTPTPDDEEEKDSRPVRSIHELRQAGDNARFQESVEVIFEEIEDSSNSSSGICNGFAQLCLKLSEPAFVRRFSEYGFIERLVRCIKSNQDVVSTSLALCAYRMVCLGGSFSHTSLRSFWTKILKIYPMLLTNNDNILSLATGPTTKLSKTTQESLKEALPHISSIIFEQELSLEFSPCLVTLSCIQFCLNTFLIKGDNIGPLPAALLDRIVELLISNGKDSKSPSSSEGSQLMTVAFLVLENYTMLSGALGFDHCYYSRVLFQHHDRFIGFGRETRNHQISTLYTRVILNLTNNDPSLCEEVATSDMVPNLVKIAIAEFPDVPKNPSMEENNPFNAVILALGILINLSEQSEMSRASFLKPAHNSVSLLQLLLQHFSSGVSYIEKAGTVPEIHYNVVIGYLSIVLVTLCLNQEAASQVKESMSGRGLTLALSTAEEFLQYHQKVDQDSQLFETRGREIKPTTRLKNVLSQIRHNVHL
ncbi:hypothetical protein BO71DRAFT_338713 [Aspergillus ellipticus CBS 707.79]|uniref:Wings apart-like protein C-terminal domain-containing protein n=1 Tax=Aspergillus ellipticus CBS 707.79 TaxID=1448320 RepID=A0A319DKA7_9EURO|nr:hypothetical protein BO71DRAFT_338713 [Aspergillus ellipticus CBS 707.79]